MRALALLALAALLGAAPAQAVTFIVTAPPATPADATLYLSGDRAELGAWSGKGPALTRRADGLWWGDVALPAGASAEFKLTRGSWDSVEKDAQGGEIGNRHVSIAATTDTVRATVAAWRTGAGGPAVARVHTRTGDIRTHAAFKSQYVSARDILVWLPPGYEQQKSRRYPVIYLLDGQNVFDGATSFIPGAEWRADEVADSLIRNGRLTPCILVAVANSPQRMEEYTAVADAKNGGGKSSAHQRFLIEELKPFIDATYRTRVDADHTGIIGSSLGGLAALDMALDHADKFGLIGSVSTSVWWGDGAEIARVKAGKGHDARVWFDIGTAEYTPDDRGHSPRMEQSRVLRDALLARGWRQDVDFHYVEVEGAAHNERAWAARIGDILQFLLGPPQAR
jgi:predicted alpha/beta superfamily hydrolase